MKNTRDSLIRKDRGRLCLLAVLCVFLAMTLAGCGSIKAISMRLQRLVGTVALYDDKGKEQVLKEQMRLTSGQRIETMSRSLVMVSLDDTKLITLEENSKADIQGNGKKLVFNLLRKRFIGSAYISI